ncbi:unnamed protein product [Thelazia callipaeda]|uniref:N-acetyltransferase domain-containing protein n=1 Tax=Thelazia callipaeda TaxID=103827 RepID=A0A0N5CNM3_THECL|nr:unnamed protein product [Thelazia callipaeda]
MSMDVKPETSHQPDKVDKCLEVLDETVMLLEQCLKLACKFIGDKQSTCTNIAEEEDGRRQVIEEKEISDKSTPVMRFTKKDCGSNGAVVGAESQNAVTVLGSKNIDLIYYKDESQMPDIMRLITKALDVNANKYVGAIICKLEVCRDGERRGYIAMLAVEESYRKMGIGTRMVQKVVSNMQTMGCSQIVLETEVTNADALRLYANLGFIREKRLFRYYLNGVDAFRLKLYFTNLSRPSSPDLPSNNQCIV